MTNPLVLYDENAPARDYGASAYELPKVDRGMRIYMMFGLLCMMAFCGGFGYWSVTAKLDGAVIAPASFVVESNRKTVQHLEGGIVRDILVSEGDYVERDQILLRMDSTDSDINIGVLGTQLAELYIRRARLIAELNKDEAFELDQQTLALVNEIDPVKRASILKTQQNLFEAQQKARLGEEEVINQRIQRFEEEIAGLEAQREAGGRQLVLLTKDVVSFEELLKRNLIAASRVNALKREIESLHGSDANLTTAQARAANQIGELKLNKISQERLRQETISAELAEIETRASSIEPQYYGAKERLKRVAVRAPVSGRIVDMQVYTNGGVIRSGDAIMDIVPESDTLIVEARVATNDIEKLRVGQDTRIRLTAFDTTDTPEATGKIVDLSADKLTDEIDGEEYYSARIRLDQEQVAAVSNLELIPGMPADVFVNTGERTAISYFLQPINDRLARTFVQ